MNIDDKKTLDELLKNKYVIVKGGRGCGKRWFQEQLEKARKERKP